MIASAIVRIWMSDMAPARLTLSWYVKRPAQWVTTITGVHPSGRFTAFAISAATCWIDRRCWPATGLTCACSILETMEVSLLDSQEAQLNDLALRTGRGTDELIQEAVSRLLAHNEWFKEQVQIGIDQIARGEFIEEEEMDARVKRMLDS